VNNGTEMPIVELENRFLIKWDNFRKTKEYVLLCTKRRITTKKEKLIIGENKF